MEYWSAGLEAVELSSFLLEAKALSQTALMPPDHKIQVRRLTDAMKDWWDTGLEEFVVGGTEKINLIVIVSVTRCWNKK